MMDPKQLNGIFEDDVNHLKSLNLDILPAKIMYWELFKVVRTVFYYLGVSVALGVLLININVNFINDSVVRTEYGLSLQIFEIIASITCFLAASMFVLGDLYKYTVFKCMLKSKIESGQHLDSKIKKLVFYAWLIHTLIFIPVAVYLSSATMSVIITFFLESLLIPFFLHYEIQRQGLGSSLAVISEIIETMVLSIMKDRPFLKILFVRRVLKIS